MRKMVSVGVAMVAAAACGAEPGVRVWIGTYTTRGSEGIYSMTLDAKTGALSKPELAAKTGNPSFLALSPNKKNLYAVGEGSPEGSLVAFAVDAAAGKLTEINRQSAGGKGPCHLATDPAGKVLIAANYGDGTVPVLPINADGSLGAAKQVVRHEGSGPNAGRQKGPHAHGITFDPSGTLVFVPDLGIDLVKAYALDAGAAQLAPLPATDAKLTPGAGPRHFAFHPSLPFAFSINELTSDMTAFAWDAKAKTMKPVASASTLPAGFDGRNSTAELAVHPNGKFLYGSNRGHNSIVVFAIDQKSGALTPVHHIASGGKTPRCFALSPDGTWLLAAHQDSDDIFSFKVDPATGKLSETGSSIKIPAPVCVLFH